MIPAAPLIILRVAMQIPENSIMAVGVFYWEVRILEILFFHGAFGLIARCLMDLVVYRASLMQV